MEWEVSNEVKDPKSFIFGGRAEFTIINLESGAAYSYNVRKPKDNKNASIFFVDVRFGQKWKYAGYLTLGTEGKVFYYAGAKGACQPDEPPVRGLMFAMRHEPLPRPMAMYHHGICAKCGRKLTDQKSIEIGFGPDCRKAMGIR